MRHKTFILSLLLALFFCRAVPALEGSKVLSILKKGRVATSDVGILITDGPRTIFALNERTRMKPASLTKIITGAAALELLGPNYTFRTQLFSSGNLERGRLKGSLYLKGGGDPTFLWTKLPLLAAALTREKIKTIEGDLLVDDTRFDAIRDADWQEKMNDINPKMFPVFLNIDPPENLSPGSLTWREQERTRRKMVNLEGRFNIYENFTEPDLWTGFQLRQMLLKQGIHVEGKVLHGKTPPSAKLLSQIETPLKTVMTRMMKASNNYYAEMLVRNLPLAFGEHQGKFEDGIEFIKYYLDYAGVERKEYSINSGSGFSHQNFVTARAFTTLLNHLRTDRRAASHFLGSLPVAGVDGTLSHRMSNSTARGRIRAKTGYLSPVRNTIMQLKGAVGLAGFAQRPNGTTWTFVLIYNGMGNPEVVRRTFDRICLEMISPSHTAPTT